MFTGIIECLGKILTIQQFNNQKRLRITPSKTITNFNCKIGDSIAINGVCLTVEKHADNHDWFEIYTSTETLKVTNLNQLKVADTVNLERALAFGDRLGGHLISGHIDSIATVKKIINAGTSRVINLAFNQNLSHYFATKCSVALDGISLTVNNCGKGFCEVNIIPQTITATTIATWHIGYTANMEIDMLSKYVYENLKQLKVKQ